MKRGKVIKKRIFSAAMALMLIATGIAWPEIKAEAKISYSGYSYGDSKKRVHSLADSKAADVFNTTNAEYPNGRGMLAIVRKYNNIAWRTGENWSGNEDDIVITQARIYQYNRKTETRAARWTLYNTGTEVKLSEFADSGANGLIGLDWKLVGNERPYDSKWKEGDEKAIADDGALYHYYDIDLPEGTEVPIYKWVVNADGAKDCNDFNRHNIYASHAEGGSIAVTNPDGDGPAGNVFGSTTTNYVDGSAENATGAAYVPPTVSGGTDYSYLLYGGARQGQWAQWHGVEYHASIKEQDDKINYGEIPSPCWKVWVDPASPISNINNTTQDYSNWVGFCNVCKQPFNGRFVDTYPTNNGDYDWDEATQDYVFNPHHGRFTLYSTWFLYANKKQMEYLPTMEVGRYLFLQCGQCGGMENTSQIKHTCTAISPNKWVIKYDLNGGYYTEDALSEDIWLTNYDTEYEGSEAPADFNAVKTVRGGTNVKKTGYKFAGWELVKGSAVSGVISAGTMLTTLQGETYRNTYGTHNAISHQTTYLARAKWVPEENALVVDVQTANDVYGAASYITAGWSDAARYTVPYDAKNYQVRLYSNVKDETVTVAINTTNTNYPTGRRVLFEKYFPTESDKIGNFTGIVDATLLDDSGTKYKRGPVEASGVSPTFGFKGTLSNITKDYENRSISFNYTYTTGNYIDNPAYVNILWKQRDIVLPAINPPAGTQFIGWYKKDGSNYVFVGMPGDSYPSPTTGDETLYPKFSTFKLEVRDVYYENDHTFNGVLADKNNPNLSENGDSLTTTAEFSTYQPSTGVQHATGAVNIQLTTSSTPTTTDVYKIFARRSGTSDWTQVTDGSTTEVVLNDVNETLSGDVNEYIVPYTGYYTITAYGADGQSYNSTYVGGKGAGTQGTYYLRKGDVITASFGTVGGGGMPDPDTLMDEADENLLRGGSKTTVTLQTGDGSGHQTAEIMVAGGGGSASSSASGGSAGSAGTGTDGTGAVRNTGYTGSHVHHNHDLAGETWSWKGSGLNPETNNPGTMTNLPGPYDFTCSECGAIYGHYGWYCYVCDNFLSTHGATGSLWVYCVGNESESGCPHHNSPSYGTVQVQHASGVAARCAGWVSNGTITQEELDELVEMHKKREGCLYDYNCSYHEHTSDCYKCNANIVSFNVDEGPCSYWWTYDGGAPEDGWCQRCHGTDPNAHNHFVNICANGHRISTGVKDHCNFITSETHCGYEPTVVVNGHSIVWTCTDAGSSVYEYEPGEGGTSAIEPNTEYFVTRGTPSIIAKPDGAAAAGSLVITANKNDLGYATATSNVYSILGYVATDLAAPMEIQNGFYQDNYGDDSNKGYLFWKAVENPRDYSSTPAPTSYEYYAVWQRATEIGMKTVDTTDILREDIVSAIAGYYYIFDNTSTTTITVSSASFKGPNGWTSNTTHSSDYSFTSTRFGDRESINGETYFTVGGGQAQLAVGNRWFHVAAVDTAGNVGPTYHIPMQNTTTTPTYVGRVAFITNAMTYQIDPATNLSYSTITNLARFRETTDNKHGYNYHGYYDLMDCTKTGTKGIVIKEDGTEVKNLKYGADWPTVENTIFDEASGGSFGKSFIGWNSSPDGQGIWYSQTGTGTGDGLTPENAKKLILADLIPDYETFKDDLSKLKSPTFWVYAIYKEKTDLDWWFVYRKPNLNPNTGLTMIGSRLDKNGTTTYHHSETSPGSQVDSITDWTNRLVFRTWGNGLATAAGTYKQEYFKRSGSVAIGTATIYPGTAVDKSRAVTTHDNGKDTLTLNGHDYTFTQKGMQKVFGMPVNESTKSNTDYLAVNRPFDVLMNVQGSIITKTTVYARQYKDEMVKYNPGFGDTDVNGTASKLLQTTTRVDLTPPALSNLTVVQRKLTDYSLSQVTSWGNGNTALNLNTTFTVTASDYNDSAFGEYTAANDSSGIYGVYVRFYDANDPTCKTLKIAKMSRIAKPTNYPSENPVDWPADVSTMYDGHRLVSTWRVNLNTYLEFPNVSVLKYEVYAVDYAGNVTDINYGPDHETKEGYLINYSIRTSIRNDTDTSMNFSEGLTHFYPGQYGHVRIWTVGFVDTVEMDFGDVALVMENDMASLIPDSHHMGYSGDKTGHPEMVRQITWDKGAEVTPKTLQFYNSSTNALETIDSTDARYAQALTGELFGTTMTQTYARKYITNLSNKKWDDQGTTQRIPVGYTLTNNQSEIWNYIAYGYKGDQTKSRVKATSTYVICEPGSIELHYRITHED